MSTQSREQNTSVIGLGSIAVDYVKKVDRLPVADGFCTVLTQENFHGGSCANVMAQLANLGVKTTMTAKIGDDDTGDTILSGLHLHGISTETMVQKRGGISLSTVIYVDREGSKAIVLQLGDTMLELAEAEIEKDWFRNHGIYYTDLLPVQPALTAMKWAKEFGHTVVVNIQTAFSFLENIGLTRDDLRDHLELVDVFAPCQEAAEELTGSTDIETIAKALRVEFEYQGEIVLTRGSQGSAIAHGSIIHSIDTHPVNVVDTTGAGDSYIGAYIFARLIQKLPIPEAGSLASKAAALTCTKLGARSSPTISELLK